MPFAPVPAATYASTAASPGTITTIVQMGLAGAITPLVTGRVFMMITGTLNNATAGDGFQVQLSYGTGSAPTNGAAAAGSTTGGAVKFVNATTNGAVQKSPFCVQSIVSGLTTGTAYWIDVQGAQITGGNCVLTDYTVTAIEI